MTEIPKRHYGRRLPISETHPDSRRPMSDNLRTRIITALLSEDDVALMADAVIRELNMRLDSTCHIHDREGKQRCHRYVTDWTADE